MRKLILFAAAIFFLQFVFAEKKLSVFSYYQHYLIIQPQSTVIPFNTTLKNTPQKEKLLTKWYKKKLLRNFSEEKEKKKIKNLSRFSLILSILSVILVILSFLTWQVALIYIGSIFFLVAIIFGAVAFAKWKKLSDKSGINKFGLLMKVVLPLILGIGFLISYLLS